MEEQEEVDEPGHPLPAVPAPRGGLGLARTTREGYAAALKYLDKYLTDKNKYPKFVDLMEDHVEGEMLIMMLEYIGLTFANDQIYTQQKTWLSTKSKMVYFGKMKEMFKSKFSSHHLFKVYDEKQWWAAQLLPLFKKECNRALMDDPDASEEYKSEGLYRDLSDNLAMVRSKFMACLSLVDAKSVTMSMIKDGSNKSIKLLTEFNVCRSGVGRAVEHHFLRWDEAYYNEYFQAPEFEWIISKQLSRQCMLFFPDKNIYSLDVLFSFGLFFITGHAERPSTMKDAWKPFVFYYLHDGGRNNIARRLTVGIQAHIADENRKKHFTSRSTRKGSATDLQMHPDISLDERVARGGWTQQTSNRNADGYVESTPCMNAPGGKALAGYRNCHGTVVAPDLAWLGAGVLSSGVVENFFNHLFIIDVPELKKGGKLYKLALSACASIVRYYNQLCRDMGHLNAIVTSIRQAAKDAKIDDPTVPRTQGPTPRWLTVLEYWSSSLDKRFKEMNPDRVQNDASLTQQVAGLAGAIEGMNRKLDAVETVLNEQSPAGQSQLIALLLEQNKLLTEANKILQQQLAQSHSQTFSPSRRRQSSYTLSNANNQSLGSIELSNLSGCGGTNAVVATSAADTNMLSTSTTTIVTASDVFAKSATSAAATTTTSGELCAGNGVSTDLGSLLDGFHTGANIATGIGGITVKEALQFAFTNGHFDKLRKQYEKQKVYPGIDSLFNKESDCFIPIHPTFAANSEGAKYLNAMKVVAMTFEKREWECLVSGKLNEKESRDLFFKISKESQSTIQTIFLQAGLVEKPSKRSKASDSVSSVALKFGELKARRGAPFVEALLKE